jgi:hypothetical protein
MHPILSLVSLLMKIISANIRGLWGKAKRTSLKCIVVMDKPNVVFLQETIEYYASIIKYLVKILLDWSFLGIDTIGTLGGALLVTTQSILNNCIYFPSGLFTKIFSKELDHSFRLLNLYGPYVAHEEL